MIIDDPDTVKRARRVMQLANERVRAMTPQERDRTMQVHLAQARGPVRNAKLLFDMTAMLLRARQTAESKEKQDV